MGSAHLATGSIDKADEALADLPIPADAWWRDDLTRRLDSAWDIKWAYPDLFTGSDFVRAIFETGLGEGKERRASAIRAFLAHHYEADAQVRFKQVELQNDLLDLFVDVPAALGRAEGTRDRRRATAAFNTVARQMLLSGDADEFTDEVVVDRDFAWESGRWIYEPRRKVGAATLLLHQTTQEELPFIVLEGAPGQGKSTLAQYVCQVHRMRLLDYGAQLSAVDETHASGPVRLPFRVDLRDLSLWLQGGSPFFEGEDSLANATRSLEGLLAGQVMASSGGARFTVDDLHAVAKVSSVLVVLDGLDEVADIDERTRVVREVNNAVTRLNAVAASLQVVVTSRPAAFANSPSFPAPRFVYCQLEAITRPLASEYAERWIRARGLGRKLAADVRGVLEDKLQEPHMRELARNPMQLAILLSLIHRRGPSLPDQRTALYDSYVDLFFDREAEKTDQVREHRDLLHNLHQYLGWRLQAEAESGKSAGNVSASRLRELLVEYLENEHHDPRLVDVIFHGLVERVVAIVSRVQGTYEFEVQPLREYFAARYLYNTAPYSPPGNEQGGDKTDRFDALARNFYWLNVTRFYAGCYSKGELPSLVDRLQLLAESDGFRDTSHPRILAVMLLSDWVFAQQPRSMRKVVELALDELGLRYATTGGGEPLTLPTGSGREELVANSWRLIRANPRNDRAIELASILVANSPAQELDQRWVTETRSAEGRRRTRWFDYGRLTQSLSRVSAETLNELMADRDPDLARLSPLLLAGRYDICEATGARAITVIDALLAGDLRPPFSDRAPRSPLEALSSHYVFSRQCLTSSTDLREHGSTPGTSMPHPRPGLGIPRSHLCVGKPRGPYASSFLILKGTGRRA